MKTIKCGIVIPVYKQCPLESEIISLKQCCKKLAVYPIIIITYKTLDIVEYVKIFEEFNIHYKIEYFSRIYFLGIPGYNALMFSGEFYKRFLNYEYIFLHQLDVYVFASNLDYWLEQGYDYIGGPLFYEVKHTQKLEFSEYFNGGVCLRRTDIFYRLSFTKPVKFQKRYWDLFQKRISYKSPLVKIWLYCLWAIMSCDVVILKGMIPNNEDIIWSSIINKEGKTPCLNTALDFAFSDCYPEYYFALNKGKLPFCCHSWDSYHSYKFWKKYIEK